MVQPYLGKNKSHKIAASLFALLLVPSFGFATDYTLDNTSSATNLYDNDTATIDEHFGTDGTTDDKLIKLRGDNLAITVNGTLQGDDEVIFGYGTMDNITITVNSNAVGVALGQRVIDIDGSTASATNVLITNHGTIYAAERNAISAQEDNVTIINHATGLINAADRTMLLSAADNLNLSNYGSILANNDNLTYRDNLTAVRTATEEGYALAIHQNTNATIVNSGTISTNGPKAIFATSIADSTITNSGTISADGIEALYLDQADNLTIVNSGSISGQDQVYYGNDSNDAVFTNQDNGSITSTNGVTFYLQNSDNFSLTNAGIIKSDNGTAIDSRNASDVTVINTDNITSGATGSAYLVMADNLTLTNTASGTMSSSGNGLQLLSGNIINNYGTLSIDNASVAVSMTGNNNNFRLFDGATVTGSISADNGTTGNVLTVDTASTQNLHDNVTGAIGITKTGTGTLTIQGTYDYSGDTTLSAGTLVVNGTASNSAITVGSGTILKGSGTSGDITNNGTLAPGNSIGTLTVSGNVTLDNSSTTEMEINGDGDADKIVISGNMTAGGTLQIIPEKKRNYGDSMTYQLVTTSGITGTFDDIRIRACGGAPSISYAGDNVTLTVDGCYAKRSASVEDMENYIHQLYDAAPSADLDLVLEELETLSGKTYEQAMASLTLDAPSALNTATQQNIAIVNNFISQRATAQTLGGSTRASLRMLSTKGPDTNMDQLTIAEKLKAHSQKGMWVRAYGGSGEKKRLKKLGVNGYDYDFAGTTIGFDIEGEGVNQGIAVSLQQGSVDSYANQGKQDYKTVMVNYQHHRQFDEGDSLTFAVSGSVTSTDAKRFVKFGGIDRTATSDYQSYAADAEVSYGMAPVRFGNFTNDVALSFGLNYHNREGYKEKGADALNLDVQAKHTITARTALLNTIYWDNNEEDAKRSVVPFLSFGVTGQRSLSSNYAKQGFIGMEKTKVVTDRDYDLFGEVSLGVLQTVKDQNEMRLMGTTKFSDKIKEYSVSLDYAFKL